MKVYRIQTTRIFCVIVCAVAFMVLGVLLVPTKAFAGWKVYQDEYYFQNDDGTYVVSDWVKYKQEYYFFDENGQLVTSDFVVSTSSSNPAIKDGTYYVDAKGRRRENYLLRDGDDIYYFTYNGTMVTNKNVTVNGVTYTFGADGKCISSTTKSSSKSSTAKLKIRSGSSSAAACILGSIFIIVSVPLLINDKTRRPYLSVLGVILTLGISLLSKVTDDIVRNSSSRR